MRKTHTTLIVLLNQTFNFFVEKAKSFIISKFPRPNRQKLLLGYVTQENRYPGSNPYRKPNSNPNVNPNVKSKILQE